MNRELLTNNYLIVRNFVSKSIVKKHLDTFKYAYEQNLLRDDELTPQEKFELYYEEYEKNKRKPKNLNSILKQLGLRKSSGGSDTH